MEVQSQKSWEEANKAYLMARLEPVRQALKRACGEETRAGDIFPPPTIEHEQPAALDTLGSLFNLSLFERDILLLCAGVELDSEFSRLCAKIHGSPQHAHPTFSLALARLPGAHWNALSPEASLRRWRLIEIETGRTIVYSPLRIDERILHYLMGISYLDKRLAGLFQPLEATGQLVPSHREIARAVAVTWKLALDTNTVELPVVQLCGSEFVEQRKIARAVCSLFSKSVFSLSALSLPMDAGELENVLHLWEREVMLGNSALVLDCRGVDRGDVRRDAVIGWFIERNKSLLIISSPERRTSSQSSLLTFEVQKPTLQEQKALWQTALGKQAFELDGEINQLVAHFHLNRNAIQTVCAGVQGRLLASRQLSPTPQVMEEALWELCRVQARPRLDDLAQRIEPMATWEDLVVPGEQCTILQEIALHVRQRTQVYETWGFAGKSARGQGISALFVGLSGVGKTMAAEVLARELRLDLYKIDLSAVISKYIGETEKNLRRVFDAAEEGGTILLFDEADAIFGKRSEVRDSHDRYANIEISYLLQRMEEYRGLAILTTNMKDILDTAFMRRIRFIVQFPFPDAIQRAEIWRRVFPQAAPTEGLCIEKLAQLNIAGGHIRNIALHAAFIAADAEEPIQMKHVQRAARHEYTKLEKALTTTETRGWDQ